MVSSSSFTAPALIVSRPSSVKLLFVVQIFIAAFTVVSSFSFTSKPRIFSRPSSVKLPDSRLRRGRPYYEMHADFAVYSSALSKDLDFSSPSSDALPRVVEIFISARFGPGHPYEKRARDICARLKRRGIKAVIVEVTAGQDFAEMTVHCTHIMQVMLVIGCDEYGAKTTNGYCSFHELQLAYQNRIPIIVVQFCELASQTINQ